MSQFRKLFIIGLALLGVSVTAAAEEAWTMMMCNPSPMCMGDCRPLALVRPQSVAIPAGCSRMGSYPSYDFARRNADSFNGKAPSAGGTDSFDHYFAEAERYRAQGDMLNAQKFYQNAEARASIMDEVLLVGEALIAIGNMQGGIAALTRARDLSSRKVQLLMVGDAFKKIERMDQAQICYDRARNATQ